MFSINIKTNCGDRIVSCDQVFFKDHPMVYDEKGNTSFVGGVLQTFRDNVLINEFNEGTAYVMNEEGKTIATYHMTI